jgi:hypothetical protein
MGQAHFHTAEERVDGGTVSREVGKVPRDQWADVTGVSKLPMNGSPLIG